VKYRQCAVRTAYGAEVKDKRFFIFSFTRTKLSFASLQYQTTRWTLGNHTLRKDPWQARKACGTLRAPMRCALFRVVLCP
jgi:hypothetical protein